MRPLQGRDATPYFERNRVGSDAIDSTAALTDMGKYLFQERRLPVYDIAVAITKYVELGWKAQITPMIYFFTAMNWLIDWEWNVDWVLFFRFGAAGNCFGLFTYLFVNYKI